MVGSAGTNLFKNQNKYIQSEDSLRIILTTLPVLKWYSSRISEITEVEMQNMIFPKDIQHYGIPSRSVFSV